jgi:hypothetical protein
MNDEKMHMATPFDSLKAQREILIGLADVRAVIGAQTRTAERRRVEAGIEFNALAKIARFVDVLIDDARTKLKVLEAQAEAQAKTG